MSKIIDLKNKNDDKLKLDIDSIFLDNSNNLWLVPNTETKNGVSLTKNKDGSIDVKGTETSSNEAKFVIRLDHNQVNLLQGHTYKIFANKDLPKGLEIRLENYNNESWVSEILSLKSGENSKIATVKIEGNKTSFGIAVTKNSTVDISNLKVYLIEQNTQKTNLQDYLNDMWLAINSK